MENQTLETILDNFRNKYEETVANAIISNFEKLAENIDDKEILEYASEVIENYKGRVASTVAYNLKEAADAKKDVKFVLDVYSNENVVNTVNSYREDAASNVALEIGNLAMNIKDEEIINYVVSKIKNYDNKLVSKVAFKLVGMALYGDSDNFKENAEKYLDSLR